MEHNTKNIKISDNIYLNYFTIEQNNLINLLNKITKNNIVLSMMYENNTLSIYTQNPISIKEKVNIEIKYEETMIPLINETTYENYPNKLPNQYKKIWPFKRK